MRIAVISNASSSAHGGAGAIAARYAELLGARGHEVRIWGPRADFLRLASMNVLQNLWFHFTDFFPQYNVINEIRSWKPDVLLTHNLMGCGLMTPRALHASGLRWVHVLHDVQLVEPSGQIIEGESFGVLRNIRRRALSVLRGVLFGAPDIVVSPTKWLLDFHKEYGWFVGVQAAVIPNPLSGSPAVSNSEQAIQLKRDPRVRYVFVGRLDTDKGIDLLLEAWKKRASVSSMLTIIGDGSWREKIVQLQAEDSSIKYKGALPHEEVQQIFAESDIAVIPSRVWENQPTVILEALSAGCRVVATNVGGIPETLQKAGWIVSSNSIEALVRGMDAAGAAVSSTVVDDPDVEHRDSVSMSKEAISVLKLHDPEVVVVALESVLKSNL